MKNTNESKISMLAVRALVVFLIATLVFAGPAMGEIPTNGLVAEWHFDGDAKDSSNGNDGTIYGATFVDGKFGKALSFNGMSDYVDLKKAFLNGKSAWTFSGWISPSNLNIIYSEGIPQVTFSINGIGGLAIWNAQYSGSSGNWMFVESPPAIKLKEWNHITISLENGDVGTGVAKFYINGILISSTKGQMENNSDAVFASFGDNIGAYHSGTQSHAFFNGLIDEVRIYNRTLNADEIKSSYESGQIIITSSVSGAEVLIDGVRKGTASPAFTVSDIDPGSHTVTCRLSGYADNVTQLNLPTSSTASVTCTLSQAPGSISVSSSPSGAEVYLDGTLKGTAPVMLKDITPGNHVIWCKKAGYEDFQQNIEATAGGVGTFTCTLKLATGTPAPPPNNSPESPIKPSPQVNISKSASITGKVLDAKTDDPVQGATISIEGISATTDSNGVYELTIDVGKHSLIVNKQGYETVTRPIIVPEVGTMLDLSLKPTSSDSSWLGIVIILLIVLAAAGIIYLLYKRKKKEKAEVKKEEKKVERAVEKKKFCMFCHAPLIAGSKFCNECGKKQDETKRFCMNCGALMPAVPELCGKCSKMPPSDVDTKACKNCGEVIPVVAKFCSACGAGQPE